MTQQNYPAMMVTGLYKKFGDKIAVNNLNLTVPRGSIFGIVGPNGAGKTTMLNMATGLLRPDAGQAIICGFDMWHDPIPAKAAMGLLADGLPVFDRLTGEEYLQYLGALRGIPEADLAPRISELLHALGLEEATDKYIADYSAGMTKKILLAGALIHNPDVLILDEPLEAVDPVSSRVIQQILRAYAAAGGTVILSSHVMELVEGLCDRVAIIHHGTVRLEGDVKELAAQTSLTDLFVSIVGGGELTEGQLQWLQHNQPEQPLGQPYPPGQPDPRVMQPEQPNQPRRFGRQEPPQPAPTAPMGEPDDLGSEPTEQFDVSALRSVEPPRTSPPYPLRMPRNTPPAADTADKPVVPPAQPEAYPPASPPRVGQQPYSPPPQAEQPGAKQPGRTIPTPSGYPYSTPPDPQPNPRQNYPNPPQYGQQPQPYSTNPTPTGTGSGTTAGTGTGAGTGAGQSYPDQPYSGNPYTDQFQQINSYPPATGTPDPAPTQQPYAGQHRQPTQNRPPQSPKPTQPESSEQEKPEDNQGNQTNQQQPRFNNPYSNGPETWR